MCPFLVIDFAAPLCENFSCVVTLARDESLYLRNILRFWCVCVVRLFRQEKSSDTYDHIYDGTFVTSFVVQYCILV